MLNLGIIGLSEGNGHPYSWSAIFNGYNPSEMRCCPFPAIPDYLSRQVFPIDGLSQARVTHIWTQDRTLSQQVADASLIPHVVDDLASLIGQVDAVLLARDDAEHHLAMATPFLEAGLPIYIDKPIAYDGATLKAIYDLQRFSGQVFTCSALAYAKEFQLTPAQRDVIGEVRHVDAVVMKDWLKYGVHVIDPVLRIIGEQGKLSRVEAFVHADRRVVAAGWESGLTATFSALGGATSPIAIRLFGTRGSMTLTFQDTFFAFKRALEVFVEGVGKPSGGTPFQEAARVVELIERGQRGA
jgi:predicted dehydrogenase